MYLFWEDLFHSKVSHGLVPDSLATAGQYRFDSPSHPNHDFDLYFLPWCALDSFQGEAASQFSFIEENAFYHRSILKLSVVVHVVHQGWCMADVFVSP